MSMRIAVLGATGVYGRHLVPRLAAAGHRVRALVREPAAATVAATCGAELAAADIFDEASIRAGLAGCDLACVVTAPPGVDYEQVVAEAPLVLDFRGVIRNTEAANLVRL